MPTGLVSVQLIDFGFFPEVYADLSKQCLNFGGIHSVSYLSEIAARSATTRLRFASVQLAISLFIRCLVEAKNPLPILYGLHMFDTRVTLHFGDATDYWL